MKKRILSLLCTITMLMALVACGNKPIDNINTDTPEDTDHGSSAVTTEYPKMAITINTHKAATNLDYAARALSPAANDFFGVNMVVNNTSGIIDGMRATLSAEPDGYTLCVANNSALVSDAMGSIDFSTIDDFTLLGLLGHNCANWLCVKADFAKENNITDLASLISYTETHPDELVISDKVGTNTNIVIRQLQANGLRAVAADCGQGADRVNNFLNGSCDIFVGPYSGISQYCTQGTAVCLVSCSSERSEFSPDVPCTYEQGYEIECQSWYFLCGPKDMDEAVVARIGELLKYASEDQTYIDAFRAFEATVVYKDPAETTEFLREQLQIMKELGLAGD